MISEFQNKRIAALVWWNKLYNLKKFYFTVQYFEGRSPYSLTGREIQEIWEAEK